MRQLGWIDAVLLEEAASRPVVRCVVTEQGDGRVDTPGRALVGVEGN